MNEVNEKNEDVKKKKKYKSGNKIGVRIVAGVLAFFMILSVVASLVPYFFI